VKEAARLRDSRARSKQGRIVVDGAREIDRALDANVEALEAFVCPELCQTEERHRAAHRLVEAAERAYQVTPEVFTKLAFGERAEGAVMVARRPQRSLNDLSLSEPPLIAVLEGVEKPGNVGAVVRSADGAGVSALLTIGGDPYAPQAIRASLGAVFSLPVCEAANHEALSWLMIRRISIFAALVEGAIRYDQADFRGPAAVVLGSEAHGLSEAWRSAVVQAVRIPMRGKADSLNVSAAAAVLLYEANRQRSAGA
jgi:TrmH family RNA methyltransferase